MKTKRVGKALAGLAFVFATSLSQAQPGGATPELAATSAASVATHETDAHGVALRPSQERIRKGHRDIARVPGAIVTTPVAYPAAPAPAMLRGEHNGELKGWVLLLMGAFLIATIFQRRYQAISDI